MTENSATSFKIDDDNLGRLDKFLTTKLDVSRNQIENLIREENIKINLKVVTKCGYKLRLNDKIDITFPEKQISAINDIDFDVEILYEDEDILVINKPSNLVVHPAPSVKEATLVDWLKFKGISLSTITGEERHGIVHRLDKNTTGVMVIAKNNDAHSKLSEQLQDKSMGRYYLAIIDIPLKDNLIVEAPIARNPKNRLKMGIVENGKYAKSAFLKITHSPTTYTNYELISAKLFTGRTHQIRVHLASKNRAILGDTLYGFKEQSKDKIDRVFLHSYLLYLKHPKDNRLIYFKAPLMEDMKNFINLNFNKEIVDEQIKQDTLINSFDNFI